MLEIIGLILIVVSVSVLLLTGIAIAGATCLAAILDKDYVSAILFGLFLLFVVGVILLAISRLLS